MKMRLAHIIVSCHLAYNDYYYYYFQFLIGFHFHNVSPIENLLH